MRANNVITVRERYVSGDVWEETDIFPAAAVKPIPLSRRAVATRGRIPLVGRRGEEWRGWGKERRSAAMGKREERRGDGFVGSPS